MEGSVSIAVPTATAAPSTTPAPMPLSWTEVEATVRAVWSQVLRIPAERIGPEDRFLAIGGSSLAAMEVLAGLEMGGIPVVTMLS